MYSLATKRYEQTKHVQKCLVVSKHQRWIPSLIVVNNVSIIFLVSFNIFFSLFLKFLQNFLAIFPNFIKILQELLWVDSKILKNFVKNLCKFPASYSKIYQKIAKNNFFLILLILFKNSHQFFHSFCRISSEIFNNYSVGSQKCWSMFVPLLYHLYRHTVYHTSNTLPYELQQLICFGW